MLSDGKDEYETDTKCTWVIGSKNASNPLKLLFHNFATECGWDHLYVFDGDSVFSPLVGSFRYVTAFIFCFILGILKEGPNEVCSKLTNHFAHQQCASFHYQLYNNLKVAVTVNVVI